MLIYTFPQLLLLSLGCILERLNSYAVSVTSKDVFPPPPPPSPFFLNSVQINILFFSLIVRKTVCDYI